MRYVFSLMRAALARYVFMPHKSSKGLPFFFILEYPLLLTFVLLLVFIKIKHLNMVWQAALARFIVIHHRRYKNICCSHEICFISHESSSHEICNYASQEQQGSPLFFFILKYPFCCYCWSLVKLSI